MLSFGLVTPSDRIDWRCAAPAHYKARTPDGTLTIHQRGWAYCPAGIASDHEWVSTGGIEIEAARKLVAAGEERPPKR